MSTTDSPDATHATHAIHASGAARHDPLLALLDSKESRVRFVDRPAPLHPITDERDLLAGVAEVDITPPPGMPKAGYSANAHTGSGFRTRLRARILHLRSGGASVALVQCDLLGGSSVVQHLVAAAIATTTDIPLAGVFMGATHTHAGPGQYLGTDFYNRFASNQSGFDPGYTHFLIQQISEGIVEAHDRRGPARVAVGSTEVWGLTRNRSLDAHVRNRAIEDRDTAPQHKFHAVNPLLHMVRVDTVDDATSTITRPLAAMVIFSVHGTGVPMQADEYNADIWAYLVGELGHRIKATTGTRAVVGAIEGTHADVAPAIRPGAAGHLEAARVGRAIGAEAAALHERLGAELSGSIRLAAALREVDLERDRSINGITLPRRPAVGAALLAGAHENLTPIVHRIPPFAPGRPKRWGRTNPHGAKWVIGSRWFQPLVLRLNHFPRVLPVHAVQIGDAVLVGLPFELTVETGRRIADAVTKQAGGRGVDQVIVSSVANEYAGYAATAEEYDLQHYEGAHTLYGPNTQAFLAGHAGRLVSELVDSPQDLLQDVLAERIFDLKLQHHLPRPTSPPGTATRRIASEARFVDPTKSTDGYWQLEWIDVAPADLHWHQPMVRVEACETDASDNEPGAWVPATRHGRAVDDQGWDLQVTHVGSQDDDHRYAVRWWDPAFRGGQPFRFVLVENNGRPELTSPPFR